MSDLSLDFYTIDGLEPITLRVAGQSDLAISAALGRPAEWKEADHAAGNVLEGDQIWAWPMALSPDGPPLGATVIDGGGTYWTVLAVVKKSHIGLWECRTRNLAVTNALDNVATVLKASYSKSAGGEALAAWSVQVSDVPARFQPVAQDAKMLEDTEWPQTTYHVILGLDIFAPDVPVEPASADYRLVDTAGRHYRIVKYQRPERIDALPIAVCVLVIEGSEGGAGERISSSGV